MGNGNGFPDVREGGYLRVPAPGAEEVAVRFAPTLSRDRFDPDEWRTESLSPVDGADGWYEIDLDGLGLPDGRYEYEFVVRREDDGEGDDGDGPLVAADPFAEEITRFRGIRGAFRIQDSERFRPDFSWEDELPEGDGKAGLPENHELVVYELPLRWASPAAADNTKRQVPDGDFDSMLTEHLDELAELGVNAIELLPIQDADVRLDWGYGSRFFFAPDRDFGGPIDAKYFVKACHQRGIRVLMDVVMNHSRESPLETLAGDRFYLDPDEDPDRPTWGGRRFDFDAWVDDHHPAREFLVRAAEFWVEEYHVDGFRLDEYKGMDHPEFVQEFTDRVRETQEEAFPDRPFLVVAEDSWNRAGITQDRDDNPDGRRVVESMWNFDFRDESRRLLKDEIETGPDEPTRTERIEALVSSDRTWDDMERAFEDGFGDLTQAVNYVTSHDMGEAGEQRLMNFVFGDIVADRGLGDGSVENVQYLVDDVVPDPGVEMDAHVEAVDRVRGAFALLLTSVGVPMFLAGEELGDVHDLDYTDWQLKMEDPVDWRRREYPGHDDLYESVSDLVDLRTSAEALHRNEVDLFYAHPEMDDDDGVRTFAYCRTGGRELGSEEQVVVVANLGDDAFDAYEIPWPWAATDRIEERGETIRESSAEFAPDEEEARLSLSPFQVRVFTT